MAEDKVGLWVGEPKAKKNIAGPGRTTEDFWFKKTKLRSKNLLVSLQPLELGCPPEIDWDFSIFI